jgi:hypothetical protein
MNDIERNVLQNTLQQSFATHDGELQASASILVEVFALIGKTSIKEIYMHLYTTGLWPILNPERMELIFNVIMLFCFLNLLRGRKQRITGAFYYPIFATYCLYFIGWMVYYMMDISIDQCRAGRFNFKN